MKNINKGVYICTAVMLLSISSLQAEVVSSKSEYVEVDHVFKYNDHEIEVLRPVKVETRTIKSNETNKNRKNDNYVEVDKIVNINGRKIEVLRPRRVQTSYSEDRERLAQEKAQREAEEQARLKLEALAKEEAARKAAEALALKEAEAQAKIKAENEAKAKFEAEKLAQEKAQREAKEQARLRLEALAKEETARKAAEALQDKKIKKLEKEFSDMFTLTRVSFETSSDRLTQKSKVLLDKVTKVIEKHSDLQYAIEGHTDSRGNKSLNKGLSHRRAKSVQNYLVSKGISEEILSSKGFGSQAPIASNDTKSGRLKNRRVIFKIIKR